jgi:hypothetical protein
MSRADLSAISAFPICITVIVSFMPIIQFQIMSILYLASDILFISLEMVIFWNSVPFFASSIPLLCCYFICY